MPTRKITALYETRAEAEAAGDKLRASGVAADHIHIHDQESGGEGLLHKLKEFFGGHEDSHAYAEGVRRGHFLLTAKVDEAQAFAACSLLEQTGPVDLEGKQTEWRTSGWSSEAAAAETAAPLADDAFTSGRLEPDREGARVRSYALDEPAAGAAPGEPVLASNPVIAEGVVVMREHDDELDADAAARQEAEREQAARARSDPDPTAAAPESDQHSIAMDATGQRIQETPEEREERLRHQTP